MTCTQSSQVTLSHEEEGICEWKTKQLVQGYFNGPGLFILNIFYRGRESLRTPRGARDAEEDSVSLF